MCIDWVFCCCRKTEDMMEPGKEREKDPNDLFSTASAIVSCNSLRAARWGMQICFRASAAV
jgi:hypothetical protein